MRQSDPVQRSGVWCEPCGSGVFRSLSFGDEPRAASLIGIKAQIFDLKSGGTAEHSVPFFVGWGSFFVLIINFKEIEK